MTHVTDRFGLNQNFVRGLMDPGAQTNLISSRAIFRLQCPMFTRIPPLRITGLRPDKDIITDQVIKVRLMNRFTGDNFITFTAAVIPEMEWQYTPPRPVCYWLQTISPVLADPHAVDNKKTDLPFQIIFSVDDTNALEDPLIPYKVGGFKATQTFFGQTLGGRNPPADQIRPAHFQHPYEGLIERGLQFERTSPSRGARTDTLHQGGNMDRQVERSYFIQNSEGEGYMGPPGFDETGYEGPMAQLLKKEELSRQAKKKRKAKLKYEMGGNGRTMENNLGEGAVHGEDLLLNADIFEWIEHERNSMFQDVNQKDEIEQDIKDLMESIQREPDGRLSVLLPKNEQCRLPLSRNVRLNGKRLEGTKRRCERAPLFHSALKENVESWIQNGFMVPVSDKELESIENWTELPYHGVMKEGDSEFLTTKFRVVMDGSAAEPGFASVNDYLRTGSNVLPKILSILTKFRQSPYFVVADIEKAFLQLLLRHPDNHLFLFRWIVWENDAWKEELYRFVRMPWGINCAPCILNIAVRFAYKELVQKAIQRGDTKRAQLIEKLGETTYVDDIVALSDSVAGLKSTSDDMLEALEASLMHVTKIRSFPPEFVKMVSPELTPTVKPYKILGVMYHPTDDQISIACDKLGAFRNQVAFTKRHAAGVGARVHSPDGLAEPAVLQAKFLFQITNQKYPKHTQWGDILEDDLQVKWKELVLDLLKISSMRFPRLVTPPKASYRVAVLFTDASGVALGGCIYIVSKTGTEWISNVVQAKSHAVPLKKQETKKQGEGSQKQALRVNRLELHAISTGTELLRDYLAWSQYPMDLVKGYTDSEVCLHWLKATKGHHTDYVHKRVTNTLTVIPASNWGHVPGVENPADILSRGCTSEELQASILWKHGPSWLCQDPTEWPTFSGSETRESEPTGSFGCCVGTTPTRLKPRELDSWRGLVTDTQLRLRDTFPKLTFEEAEVIVIRSAQAQEYCTVYQFLTGTIKACKVPERDRRLIDELGLFMGPHELIWSRSRNAIFRHLQKTTLLPLDHDLILFPPTGFEAKLMIQFIHEKETGHGTANVVMAALRTKFWMPRARILIKSVRDKCLLCKMLKSKAYWQQEAPLPEERYDSGPDHRQRAFDACGIDYVGPFHPYRPRKGQASQVLYEHLGPDTVRHILVFSCALTRAIHLECCWDVGFEQFVLAFERFIARHSQPRVVYSDNANTFGKAKRTLWALPPGLIPHMVKTYPDISWKFNVSRAPWWGGFYERMMTMVKTMMSLRFAEQPFPCDSAFDTAVCVVQRYINSRPLTQASDSDRENPTYLTPNHFLKWQPETEILRAFSFDLKSIRTHSLTDREMKQRQVTQSEFHHRLWDDFQLRYLAELRKFHSSRVRPTGPSASQLKIGDLVLVPPEQNFKRSRYHRLEWPVGQIVDLPSTRDTRYRPVEVEVKNDKGRVIRLRRPAQRLYALEPAEDAPDLGTASLPPPHVMTDEGEKGE
jgi:hypothetical protein